MSNFRFFKRIKILPGLFANLSKSGVSLSADVTGLKATYGKKSSRLTIGIPDTGIYMTNSYKNKNKNKNKNKDNPINNQDKSDNDSDDFFENYFTSALKKFKG